MRLSAFRFLYLPEASLEELFRTLVCEIVCNGSLRSCSSVRNSRCGQQNSGADASRERFHMSSLRAKRSNPFGGACTELASSRSLSSGRPLRVEPGGSSQRRAKLGRGCIAGLLARRCASGRYLERSFRELQLVYYFASRIQ
jgi:hypothetical protein